MQINEKIIKFSLAGAVLFCTSVNCSAGYSGYHGYDMSSREYSFTTSKTKDGFVLKSKKVILYLGNNCDAYSPKFGKGTWGWANGGMIVNVGKQQFGFPRQDPPFEDTRCSM